MENDTKGQSYDALNFDEKPIAEASLSDLSADQLKEFVAKVIAKREIKSVVATDEAILLEMKIIAKAGGKVCPTVTGLLLFGKNPQKYLWSSSVKIVRFSGKDKSGHIIEQKELRGTIQQMIEEAEHFLVRNMKLFGSVQGVKRTDVPEYPLDALREIVVNALIHRDYSVAGSTCRIFMFDDKIEFYSPGSLCAPTDVTNIETTQFLRNKNLVEALFYEGGFVEKLGTGITRMKNYLKQVGLKEPKYFDNGTDFEVVVFGPEDRVLQIEKSDRAKKLRKTIGMARKPEEVSESLEDFKKEDREMLEEKIRHEKKKEEAKLKRKALHRKVTVATLVFFGMIFVFLYGKRINSPEYIFDRAASMHSQKDYRQAARYYKKFAVKYPKSAVVEDAYYFLGACLEMMGDDTGAIENYQKVIAMFPNGSRRGYSQFWIGKLQLKDKKYEDAISSFRQSVGVYSEKELIDDAMENIAECYRQMGKYDEVIKTYLEMIRLNDSISDGHELYEIAAAYEKLGDADKAREYYLKVTMNKATTVEWLEKSRSRLVALEGEKYKIETKEQ